MYSPYIACNIFLNSILLVLKSRLFVVYDKGDSGGPLQCNEGGKVVAGITSWGVVGCQGMPSVYTRVSNYNGWINDNLN